MEAGKIVSLYKVSGQRRVLAIIDPESTDELEQIVMGDLPMFRCLKMEEVLPLREYEAFTGDARQR